jgi:uroporphyrinogen decarboxylase
MNPRHKERVRRAFAHEPVDHLPTQINYTQAAAALMAKYLEVASTELPTRLDNHLLRVGISSECKHSKDGRLAFDWWGVGFDTREEGYFVTFNPLAETKDLDHQRWPDPHSPGLLDAAVETIERDGGRHFVVPNLGFALFERAWALRGFDTFLLDLALDPSFAEELLERVSEVQLVLIRRFLELGVDGGYFGDDYGGQNHMLFSPRMWRKLIKPRLARLFAPFREAGLPVILHSDGQIADILPDLVEIGVTVYNPVQPQVLDHAWLRSTFGDQLAYYGRISTQTVLPNGSAAEVKQAIVDCAAALAPNGTGLLMAPSHRLMTDIRYRMSRLCWKPLPRWPRGSWGARER